MTLDPNRKYCERTLADDNRDNPKSPDPKPHLHFHQHSVESEVLGVKVTIKLGRHPHWHTHLAGDKHPHSTLA